MTTLEDMESLLLTPQQDLFRMADAVRAEQCGDAVHLRGIIEFSNVCSRDCAYCGLRRSNGVLRRYTMSPDEVVEVAAAAQKEGVRTLVLQSGENEAAPPERLADIVARIKRRFDVAVTLCVGVCPVGHYELWRASGADRYLLKHEAASDALYRRFHPDSRLADRLGALHSLRRLGYQVGTGNIIGLPRQTIRDLAEDLLLTQKLDVDMAAFGPFVPHSDTPPGRSPAGGLQLALQVVAAARVALGPVHIPATTAFDAISDHGRESALRCGANVIMANLTPEQYRELYDIYPSRRSLNCVERVKEMLRRIGRPLATDQGHSLKTCRLGT